MLYNPNWDNPPAQSSPLTIDRLIAWLETQPPDEEYRYKESRECAICQMLRATGYPKATVGSEMVWLHGAGFDYVYLPSEMDAAVAAKPHTFGAALARAREAIGG
jgi:hypothetical protein